MSYLIPDSFNFNLIRSKYSSNTAEEISVNLPNPKQLDFNLSKYHYEQPTKQGQWLLAMDLGTICL